MVRELGAGGTERQLTELARSLDRSQFEVHAGCFRLGFRVAELEEAGVRILQLPVTSFMNASVLRGAWMLRQYLRRNRIEIVHTFDFPMNCFGPFVARAAGTRTILTSQRAHRNLTPQPYLSLLRLSDRVSKGIVVNSAAVRQDMISTERIAEGKLHLCYNGIDTKRFNAVGRARMPSFEGAAIVVGVVCVLRPEKGLSTLLEGVAKALGGRGKAAGVRLVVVGSGPELMRLRSLSETLGIAELCQFEPETTRVADWLKSIDIFVLPSLSEALSNSLMEAMACGCACVASRTGGNPELISDGENGLLFEPGNSSALAENLNRLIANCGLRRQFAEAASRKIQERFSLGESVRRMTEIYFHLHGKA